MKPERMCGGCMKRADKKSLLRIVRTPDGKICIDHNQKLAGRGTYICRNESCLNAAIKKKWLSRGLKAEIPADIYEQLRHCVNPGE